MSIEQTNEAPSSRIRRRRVTAVPLTDADAKKEDCQHIRELRSAIGMSEEEFARECRVTGSTALLWEAGQERPSVDAWRYMAKLAVPPVDRATALWYWKKTGVAHPERREREQRLKASLATSDKESGTRICKLRSALGFSQEEFARECKVTRIAALRWESGQARPSLQAWRYMAKLASQAAPSNALWFWEKAGVDREALLELFPEFEKLSKAAEQRIKKMVAEPVSDMTRVPLVRDALRLGRVNLVSPGEVENWISLPKGLVSNATATFALRISTLFVKPIFSPGDVVVIDTAQTDVLKLVGMLVAVHYVPSASTTRALEAMNEGSLPPRNRAGWFWPHLKEGLYVGWLGNNPSGWPKWPISVDSAKIEPGDPSSSNLLLEFTVPVAKVHTDKISQGTGELILNEETHLLGRVICWMSA
jgi:DNA-binding transcriptional regulator YiaG